MLKRSTKFWYWAKTTKEVELATVQPSNQLITGRWLVPVRMQMFPYHGSKVKPVEMVTIASHCFQSIQSKISSKYIKEVFN
jgi:hypothetical protein